jgi:hypothetical protein
MEGSGERGIWGSFERLLREGKTAAGGREKRPLNLVSFKKEKRKGWRSIGDARRRTSSQKILEKNHDFA